MCFGGQRIPLLELQLDVLKTQIFRGPTYQSTIAVGTTGSTVRYRNTQGQRRNELAIANGKVLGALPG